jgi:hypothetical protein
LANLSDFEGINEFLQSYALKLRAELRLSQTVQNVALRNDSMTVFTIYAEQTLVTPTPFMEATITSDFRNVIVLTVHKTTEEGVAATVESFEYSIGTLN